jgi:hypothetical protein
MLGNGTTNPTQLLPQQVLGLPNNVIQASGGDNFSAVLTADGYMWTFGLNSAGQLGNGDPSLLQKLSPVQVVGLTNVKYITDRDFHAQAIKTDGTVWSWGSGVQGELGVLCTPLTTSGTPFGSPPPAYCTNSNIPVEVLWPMSLAPVNGACGSSSGATLTSQPTANLCAAGTSSTVAGQRVVDMELRRQQWRQHKPDLLLLFSAFAGERNLRLVEWCDVRERANHRALLFPRRGVRRQRYSARVLDLELRRQQRRFYCSLLWPHCVMITVFSNRAVGHRRTGPARSPAGKIAPASWLATVSLTRRPLGEDMAAWSHAARLYYQCGLSHFPSRAREVFPTNAK